MTNPTQEDLKNFHHQAQKLAFEITQAFAGSPSSSSSTLAEAYESVYNKIYEINKKSSNLE